MRERSEESYLENLSLSAQLEELNDLYQQELLRKQQVNTRVQYRHGAALFAFQCELISSKLRLRARNFQEFRMIVS